jgi:hypothetical protein
MENEYLTVEVDAEGISVYDKEHLRDVFDGKASMRFSKTFPLTGTHGTSKRLS